MFTLWLPAGYCRFGWEFLGQSLASKLPILPAVLRPKGSMQYANKSKSALACTGLQQSYCLVIATCYFCMLNFLFLDDWGQISGFWVSLSVGCRWLSSPVALSVETGSWLSSESSLEFPLSQSQREDALLWRLKRVGIGFPAILPVCLQHWHTADLILTPSIVSQNLWCV